MNDYWLLAPTLAASLVAIAFALLWRKEHEEYRILASDFKGEVAQCKQERDDAIEKYSIQKQYQKLYEEENKLLIEKNADLSDALKEAQHEVQRWQRQTAQMPETTIPARPKRTATKKKEVASE